MAAIEKVKILVLGDSGVGKSSLTHLIAHNEPISNPSWTVGCSVDVKLHEFREGTQYQKTYFIELWDIGGSSNHINTRSVFYNSVHGLILVHDLTNRKSQHNLKYWLNEVINTEGGKNKQIYDEFDSEQFAGSTLRNLLYVANVKTVALNPIPRDLKEIGCQNLYIECFICKQQWFPMLVIGTKLDLAGENRLHEKPSLDVAQEWGADKIYLNSRDSRSLSPGSSSSVILSRFFDKVIEMRYHTRELLNPYGSDKRRTYPSSAMSPKLYHND